MPLKKEKSNNKNYRLKKRIILFFIYIILPCILIYTYILHFKSTRSYDPKLSHLKYEMIQLQEIIDTYGFDNKGYYPNNISLLKKEAIKGDYWSDFSSKIYEINSLPSLQNNNYVEKFPQYSILYYVSKSKTNYYIYGVNKNLELIKDNNEKFYYLTNTQD